MNARNQTILLAAGIIAAGIVFGAWFANYLSSNRDWIQGSTGLVILAVGIVLAVGLGWMLCSLRHRFPDLMDARNITTLLAAGIIALGIVLAFSIASSEAARSTWVEKRTEPGFVVAWIMLALGFGWMLRSLRHRLPDLMDARNVTTLLAAGIIALGMVASVLVGVWAIHSFDFSEPPDIEPRCMDCDIEPMCMDCDRITEPDECIYCDRTPEPDGCIEIDCDRFPEDRSHEPELDLEDRIPRTGTGDGG